MDTEFALPGEAHNTLCVWCLTDVPHCEVVACKWVAVFCDGCVQHCDALMPLVCTVLSTHFASSASV